jgi:hypothetical protein
VATVKKKAVPRSRVAPRAPLSRTVWALPLLVAALLSVPTFRYVFLWDDFLFLRRAMTFDVRHFLPDPTDDFYRPISRELYFGTVVLFKQSKVFASHALNLLALLACVALTIRAASRLNGPRAGLISGLLFASIGQAPLLVAWASGAQDLLATLLFLGALYFRIDGRNAWALGLSAAAILCKETVVLLLPVLISFDWLIGRTPSKPLWNSLGYGSIVIAWGVIHPGLRHLLSSGFRRGTTDYLGIASGESIVAKLLKYILTLLNIPVTGRATHWPAEGTGLLVIAIGATIVCLCLGFQRIPISRKVPHLSTWRTCTLSFLLTAPPLLLAAGVARYWLPYYVVIAGVGSSMFFGWALSRAPLYAAALATIGFLLIGFWSRGMELPPQTMCERNLVVANETIRKIEHGFKSIRPELPHGTQALVSVQVGGGSGAYTQLYELQPLQVWYDDLSIRTVRPTEREQTRGPEMLFAVTPHLDVVEFDPVSLGARSSGAPPNYAYGEMANRLYALGLFASGEAGRAVNLILRMPEASPGWANIHRRLAGALLMASGESAEAESLVSRLPSLPRDDRIQAVYAFLAQPLRIDISSSVLWAFEIPDTDAAALDTLLTRFEESGSWKAALSFAQRLRHLRPRDSDLASRVERLAILVHNEQTKPRWGMLARNQ